MSLRSIAQLALALFDKGKESPADNRAIEQRVAALERQVTSLIDKHGAPGYYVDPVDRKVRSRY